MSGLRGTGRRQRRTGLAEETQMEVAREHVTTNELVGYVNEYIRFYVEGQGQRPYFGRTQITEAFPDTFRHSKEGIREAFENYDGSDFETVVRAVATMRGFHDVEDLVEQAGREYDETVRHHRDAAMRINEDHTNLERVTGLRQDFLNVMQRIVAGTRDRRGAITDFGEIQRILDDERFEVENVVRERHTEFNFNMELLLSIVRKTMNKMHPLLYKYFNMESKLALESKLYAITEDADAEFPDDQVQQRLKLFEVYFGHLRTVEIKVAYSVFDYLYTAETKTWSREFDLLSAAAYAHFAKTRNYGVLALFPMLGAYEELNVRRFLPDGDSDWVKFKNNVTGKALRNTDGYMLDLRIMMGAAINTLRFDVAYSDDFNDFGITETISFLAGITYRMPLRIKHEYGIQLFLYAAMKAGVFKKIPAHAIYRIAKAVDLDHHEVLFHPAVLKLMKRPDNITLRSSAFASSTSTSTSSPRRPNENTPYGKANMSNTYFSDDIRPLIFKKADIIYHVLSDHLGARTSPNRYRLTPAQNMEYDDIKYKLDLSPSNDVIADRLMKVYAYLFNTFEEGMAISAGMNYTWVDFDKEENSRLEDELDEYAINRLSLNRCLRCGKRVNEI